MTPTQLNDRINRLPKWAREYIHLIETIADPQQTMAELVQLREQRKQLIRLVAKLQKRR